MGAAHPAPLTRHYLPISVAIATVISLAIYWRRREPIDPPVGLGGAVAAAVVPRLLAVATFLAGAILLFSGATPPVGGRLSWIDDVLPLPVVEVAHFFGSIAGIGLLILARGIQRRLDAAYHLTVSLLAAGILLSLLKGVDYEEAALLAVLLALVAPNRRHFVRRTSIIEERFTPGWIAAIALMVLGSVLLGYLSYHQLAGRMLWDFEFDRTAPRFLRATVGVVLVLVAFAAARLLRPARPQPPAPTADDLSRALVLAAAEPDASAHLVLLGDKSILFSDSGHCFIMYAPSGRSWVALGDPVGAPDEAPDLAGRFIDASVRAGGWPVFYKVSRERIGLYLDFGLSIVKLGEEARVCLGTFALDSPERRNLRRVWRKAVGDGCRVEILQDPEQIRPLLPTLRAVSDDWLRAKRTREKSFSLGRFDEEYLLRLPVGIVRQKDRIIAFANVWPSGADEEIEVDLMRFAADAPPGIMRFLLTELILWGTQRGFRWFNLGMAPLSGLRSSLVAPLWYQIGIALYGQGERFYNFQGIRAFKEWFRPRWEPKYLAHPGGALRPIVLANIAALIAGGYEGVLRK